MADMKWLNLLATICVVAMLFAGCGAVDENNPLTPTPSKSSSGTTTTTSETPSGTSLPTTTTSTSTGEVEVGSFQLLVSDAPADIEDFDHLNVTLSKARVFKVGGYKHNFGYGYGGYEEPPEETSDESETGHKIIPLENVEVDLTRLVNEKSVVVSETELDAGRYTKIELYVEDVEGKLSNSDKKITDIKVPSGRLKITKNFQITPGESTKFVFDINVIKKGHKDSYNLLPVISQSGVVGKDLKEEEVELVE